MSSATPNQPQGTGAVPATTNVPPVQSLAPTAPAAQNPPPPDDGSHKQALYDNLQYSENEFDKMVLYIMSGMLAVSFAFIEKIIPLKTAEYKGLLVWGWIILCFGIFVYLVSHFVMPYFYNEAIRLYDVNQTPEQESINKKANTFSFCTNLFLLALALAGAILIMSFIKINLNEKEEKTKPTPQTTTSATKTQTSQSQGGSIPAQSSDSKIKSGSTAQRQSVSQRK